MKRLGAIGSDECEQILRLLAEKKTVSEIAGILNRTETAIESKITELQKTATIDDHHDLKISLRKKDYWQQIRRCLLDDGEIKFFEEEWVKIMSQLGAKYDVLHTDEMQVRDIVLQDIYCFRIHEQIANCTKSRRDFAANLERELSKENSDAGQIQLLQNQISLYDQMGSSLSKQLVDSKKEKADILKSLRTTREQRLKNMREQHSDLFSLLDRLTGMKERMENGRMADLVDMSSRQVEEEWSKLHTYADGELDRPILNSDSVTREDKNE